MAKGFTRAGLSPGCDSATLESVSKQVEELMALSWSRSGEMARRGQVGELTGWGRGTSELRKAKLVPLRVAENACGRAIWDWGQTSP